MRKACMHASAVSIKRMVRHEQSSTLPGQHLQSDFQNVCECFRKWKREPLVYRREQTMFEGWDEVRMLLKQWYEDGEQARKALQMVCSSQDSYAFAAEVSDGDPIMWIVMAAYEE
jgi:hypothetical protein